ncbi:MAG: hypothetical protein ACM30G_04105 [Micromonosporaceae bacterium]
MQPNPGAAAADLTARIVSAAPSVIPGAGEVAGVVDTFVAARRWISDRHNWVRVAWVVSGFVLIATGVAWMARRPIESRITETAQTAAAVAK